MLKGLGCTPFEESIFMGERAQNWRSSMDLFSMTHNLYYASQSRCAFTNTVATIGSEQHNDGVKAVFSVLSIVKSR